MTLRGLHASPQRRHILACGLASVALYPRLGSAQPAAGASPATAVVVVGRDGWLFPSWDPAGQRIPAAQLRSICGFMNEAVAVLKAGRMDVMINLIPAKMSVYRQFLPAGMAVSPEVDRRYAISLEELRKPGTPAPDLNAPFRQAVAARPGENLFFKTDTHWTPRGADLAATEIARVLQERFRLPASARPGTRLGGTVTQTHAVGDLQRLLTPAERAAYRPEEYPAREVQAAGGLLDDEGGDIVALGSSYMDPRYQFHPLLSNKLNRPVQLAWRPNNFGPYFTMLEYFRSEAFRRQRPRLVAWNLLEQDMQHSPNAGTWGRYALTQQAFLTELRQLVGA